MDIKNTDNGQLNKEDLYQPESVSAANDAPVGIEPHASESEHRSPEVISWTASEFIAHHKTVWWYLILALVAIVLAAFVWFITKDYISTSVVIIGALLLGIYASHKPRQISYELNNQGLTIGARHYVFRDFRSFSVVAEGAFSSIELVPLKRFAMYVTVYFDPADEEKIINVLSAHLPMEEPRNDFVEQLMRRVRF